MKTISFFVLGDPVAQPRPRAFARKIGQTWQARIFNPGTAEAWKNSIAAAAQHHIPTEPFADAVRVDATFYFKRPVSHFKTRGGQITTELKPRVPLYHTSRPDRDNLDKAVLDCLTCLGFFRDDCKAAAGEIFKFYENATNKPGCQITITELENVANTSAARTVFTLQPDLLQSQEQDRSTMSRI